jgi:hypothetical protein
VSRRVERFLRCLPEGLCSNRLPERLMACGALRRYSSRPTFGKHRMGTASKGIDLHG